MSPPSQPSSGPQPNPGARETSDPWSERCSYLFEELKRPARSMVARAYGSALSDEEVEDVYSAAWTATLSALRKRGKEMNDHELRAYVLTAVASHASKELRRRSRKPVAVLDEPEQHVVADRHQPLPEERAIGSESRSIARDLLSSLPARRRAVMLLRYGWGLSPDEICALVSGLSRRAYRKEISRGVEQLIERLAQVESGEWCESRQPMLRDYIAGTADEATRLQVEQHLRHCRGCAAMASMLRDQLNDLGGIVVLGASAGLVAGPSGSLIDRAGALMHSGRETASTVADKAELAAGTVSASGGVRGAGVAGSGLAAKFAVAGGAGKAALACIGAGAAATACVAAGVVPGITLDRFGFGGETDAKQVRVDERRVDPAPRLLPDGPPAPPPATTTSAASASPSDPAPEPEPGQPVSPPSAVTPEPEPVPEEFDPLAAPAEPAAVPTPEPPSAESGAGGGVTGSGGGGSIAGSEFGP